MIQPVIPWSERITSLTLHPELRGGPSGSPSGGAVVATLVIVAILGAVLVNVVYLFLPPDGLLSLRLALLAATLALPLVTRRITSMRAVRLLALTLAWTFVTALVLTTGGATSSSLYLYALVPVLSASLGHSRGAHAWTIATAAAVTLLFALQGAGVRFPSLGHHSHTVDVATLAVGSALVYALTAHLLAERRRTRARLREAVEHAAAVNTEGGAARASLERADEAKRVVLTRVGRGFRGPVEAVAQSARALRDELPTALQGHAAMIERSAEQLLARLQTFVAYTEALAPPPAEAPPVDLAVVIRAALERHATRATAKHLTLSWDGAAPAGLRRCDGARLDLILDALLDNAIRFTRAGGVTITAGAFAGGLVEIAVLDTGPGVPPDLQERVFEPFFRADATTAATVGGAGLGLALALRLAASLGGALGCANRAVGPGARFTLTLRLPRHDGGKP